MGRYHYVFPKWSNLLLPGIVIAALTMPPYVVLMVAYGFSPKTTDVGYMPTQVVPYNHELHAGQLGIDCRYCHNTVEHTARASVPPTQTCMNCHTQIHKDSVNIKPLLTSFVSGEPVHWTRVHDLPDFAYFNHSAHVTRGVSCVECHGRVDRMKVVYQFAPLSMGWCLDCHRNPDTRIRDPKLVTDLAWGVALTDAQRRDIDARYKLNLGDQTMLSDADKRVIGTFWRDLNHLNPSQDCSTCHR